MTLPEALAATCAQHAATPQRFFLPDVAEARYADVNQTLQRLRGRASVHLAASVKTNPDARLLGVAKAHGSYAEAISPEEIEAARAAGFPMDEIIYNGPLRLRGKHRGRCVRFAFADSLEAFEHYLADRVAEVVGVRLRPPQVHSRFGVACEHVEQIASMLKKAHADAFALSFHVRPEDYGGRSWSDLAGAVIAAADAISSATRLPLAAVDGGGGWTPDAFDAFLENELPAFIATLEQRLPALHEVILEPGQAMATPTGALMTSVLEVRRRDDGADVVVDATVALLPKLSAYRHRIYGIDPVGVTLLEAGTDRILGAACLEDDILANDIALPRSIAEGDRLIVADCGSYDASMAYAFAGHARV